MKRIGKILTVSVMALVLCTACGVKSQIELTDEQNEMVAEYLSGLLLKHNLRYEDALIYASQEEEAKTTSKSSNGAKQTKDSDTTKKKNSDSQEKNSAESVVSADNGYAKLEDIYGSLGCKVSVSNAKLCSSYPENSDASYYPIDAPKGKKLLVVTFKVKNMGKARNISFTDSNVTFRIDDGQGMTSQPLLTALTDDIQFFKSDIGGGKWKQAVLVFEVPKDISLGNYALYTTRDNITAKTNLSK